MQHGVSGLQRAFQECFQLLRARKAAGCCFHQQIDQSSSSSHLLECWGVEAPRRLLLHSLKFKEATVEILVLLYGGAAIRWPTEQQHLLAWAQHR